MTKFSFKKYKQNKQYKQYKQNKSKKIIGGNDEPINENNDLKKEYKDSINSQLKTATNPENLDKSLELVQEVKNKVKIGEDLMDAAKPFIGKLVDTVVKSTSGAADKIGKAGMKVILNTATEIPGVGIIVGTARSLDTIGKTFAEVAEASAEVVKATANTVKDTAENYQKITGEGFTQPQTNGGGASLTSAQLIKKKKKIEQRINDSIIEHLGGGKIKTRKLKRFLRNIPL